MRGALVLVAGLAVGCAGERPAPSPSPTTLRDAVARVGDVVLGETLVGATAAAQGVAPSESLALLVNDAVAAVGATKRGLPASPTVRSTIRAAVARATLAETQRSVAAMGEPTEEEVRVASDARWAEVDVPEQRSVVHAVVLTARGKSAESDPDARALAQRIADAVGSGPIERFDELATAAAAGSKKVRVEHLPPFIADGRVSSGEGGSFDRAFAAAAFALPAIGATSAPIATSFGWHVIRLLEVRPPRVMPLEERRAFLRDDILRKREKHAYTELLARLRQSHPPEIDPAADALLASVGAR
jgi:hypothetical protein